MRVTTLGYKPWAGQVVRDDRQIMYASVFRDVVDELGRDAKESAEVN